jgi:hypothetical protein
VVPKRRQRITTRRCIIFQTTADLRTVSTYTAAVLWNMECTPPVAYTIGLEFSHSSFGVFYRLHHWYWCSFVETSADINDCIKRSANDMPVLVQSVGTIRRPALEGDGC